MRVSNEVEIGYVISAIVFKDDIAKTIIDTVVESVVENERANARQLVSEKIGTADYLAIISTDGSKDAAMLAIGLPEDPKSMEITVRKVFPTPFAKMLSDEHVMQMCRESLYLAIATPDCPLHVKKYFYEKLKAELENEAAGSEQSEPDYKSDEFPSGI